ncbi:MAG: hypothetical protein HOD13_06050 [Rhodospirillaceae bacterium]|mgnify:FL=1|nr:hypothetical protein [Rhodospirillaceae bacterium]
MAVKPKKNGTPKLLELVLEFPYRKLFGRTGKIIIASSIVIFLITNFFLGIDTVRLDPKTCKLSHWDIPYLMFHKKQILRNSSISFQKSMRENQVTLRHINDGINPFKSKKDGNVTRARKINRDKFMWKSMGRRLVRENQEIIKCLGKLPRYKF